MLELCSKIPHFKIVFLIFPQKTMFYMSCELSSKECRSAKLVSVLATEARGPGFDPCFR